MPGPIRNEARPPHLKRRKLLMAVYISHGQCQFFLAAIRTEIRGFLSALFGGAGYLLGRADDTAAAAAVY